MPEEPAAEELHTEGLVLQMPPSDSNGKPQPAPDPNISAECMLRVDIEEEGTSQEKGGSKKLKAQANLRGFKVSDEIFKQLFRQSMAYEAKPESLPP